jgi:hypothetical protein
MYTRETATNPANEVRQFDKRQLVNVEHQGAGQEHQATGRPKKV